MRTDSIYQTKDADQPISSNSKEYLERLNFLYWYERFPEEVELYANHATCKRLREKYAADISSIDTVARICMRLERSWAHE